MKKLYAVLILVILYNCYTAQNESQNWYFGNMAGLSFSTSPPTPLFNSSLTISEGCATISDGAGNLLFYTDGITVKDQTHATMANGTGLQGNSSSTQSGVIVKQPGNTNIYYIFTADAVAGGYGIKYSIVDMALAAGMGSVTAKNVPLFTPAPEKILAIKHANGSDVWIISHEWNTNNFVAYLLTSAGVNMTPVITPIGQVRNGSPNWCGYLKSSPNGRKIGMATTLPAATAGGTVSAIELYDFDRATGVVSNSLSLSNIVYAYSCEFSPDGTKFYAGQWIQGGNIFQWDLCAGSNNGILASQYTVTTGTGKGALQLAPDGKIYISRPGAQQYLDIIQNPNVAGAGCNYLTPGVSIAPMSCQYGLPNFTSYQSAPLIGYTFTACNTVLFAAQISGNTTLGGWNFGDLPTGAANTSSLTNPVHVFSGQGTYTVMLTVSSCVGQDTLYAQITNTNAIQVSGSGTLCAGKPYTLTATAVNTCTWSNGATGSVTVITPTASGVYSLTGMNSNSCTVSGSLMLNVSPNPVISVTVPTLVCKGSNAVLTATGAATYAWSNGATGSVTVITPTVSGVYSLTGMSSNSCIASASLMLNVSPDPVISVTGPTLVCKGNAAVLTATGAATYTWSTNALTPTISITPAISTTYTVTGKNTFGCVNTKTVTLTIYPCTALPEIENVNRFSIYPNPATGDIFVSSAAKGELGIYDINGDLKLQVSVPEGDSVIDLRNLSSGVYFVRYKTTAGTKEIRLIKTGD